MRQAEETTSTGRGSKTREGMGEYALECRTVSSETHSTM